MDQVRGFFRHFLDFHAAFGGGHEYNATGATIDDRAQVKLFIDIGRGFDQDLIYRLTVCVRLVGHQTLTKPVFCKGANFFFAVNHFHAACFTTATRVYLTFHYPRASTNFGCRFFSFARGVTGVTYRRWQTIAGKQLFGLIFM